MIVWDVGRAAEISLEMFKYNSQRSLLIYQLFMSQNLRVFALLLLLTLAASQTPPPTTCSNSAVSGIASGIIRLGVPMEAVASTSYSQTLSGFSLGTWAQVFAAFAVAGFQASSTQNYYSLLIQNVIFSNGNTQMNFTMMYTNPAGTFQTTWTSIKLSWVAVSTGFQTVNNLPYGNYVWAGSVGINGPFPTAPGPVIPNSLWSNVPASAATDAQCGYINSSPPHFDINCGSTFLHRFVTHYYIMGFQFNPSGTFKLAASVLRNDGTGTALADVNEALEITATQTSFTVRAVGSTSTAELTGPKMIIDSIGGQLQFLQIGIVITTILDYASYPTTNPASFQYAGVYMNYTLYNTAQPIIAVPIGDRTATTGLQNYNYYTLLSPKYQIFGLSSFYIGALPTGVTVVNYELSLPGSSTVLFQTDNVNYMTFVRVSADQWSNVATNICVPQTAIMRYIVQKYVSTVPTMQTNEQTIYQTSSDLIFTYFARGSYQPDAPSPLSPTVVFYNILYFQNVSVGSPYKVDFDLTFVSANLPIDTLNGEFNITYQLKIDGNLILSKFFTRTTGMAASVPVPNPIGYVFNRDTPTIEINIVMPRGRDDTAAMSTALDRSMVTSIILTKYSIAYNPLTDCCDTTCPVNSGVILPATGGPAMCIACSAGLFYNTVASNCQCKIGYYQVTQAATNDVQCYPCLAPLCQSCLQTTKDVCTTCVSGASVNAVTNLCTCNVGFYQNISICNACPHQCASCTTSTVCTTCSDNTTRTLSANCVCNTGFYDAGSAVCQTCPILCRTCSSATTCTSCFTQKQRVLINGQCVCKTGFYQVAHTNGTFSCEACDPSCNSCNLTPDRCDNCDAAAFRVLAYDSLGNKVCDCIPGYYPNSNGQCVQSNCVADLYCSTCITVIGVSQCIRCIAATHRRLVLPQQKCECSDGYYELTGICTPCGEGCAKCKSATTCDFCVASANTNNNGTCKCPDGYFFTISPTRYCRRCPNYTLTCSSDTQALTCVANFNLVNGVCVCPSGRYINNLGDCMPCVANCASCNSSTECQACVVPYLLQGNACVSRCGPGYFQNGFVCTACSPGCAMCKGPNICLICLAGQLSYNGFCHKSCPPGSVASNSSTCVDCNSPCKTCTEHPTKCTSCQSCCGNLFNFRCLEDCPVGTFSANGTCQYCAYKCKTCLGLSTTCTSCPEGKILYNGDCYDKCPYVMIGGICTFNCAKGLYKTKMNECVACNAMCATCDVDPNNCTTCKPEFGFALKGVCMRNCPANYLSIDGECKPCNPECKGCINTCSNCLDCAVGYYKLGATCVKTCYPNMFVDNANNLCVTCNDKCKTCSSLSFCTTCANPQAVPVNGVCNDCSYPCNTCTSSPSSCTSCVAGFNLIGTTCIAACPTGAFPKNGVCQCNTGALFGSQCVPSCPAGYGNIGGQCQQCNENCAACNGNKQLCTECLNGYALDQVNGLCQKAPNCQFGQYFSQSSNGCTRICPQNTYFYENVCLTACLSGFYDNGVGGCVATTPQTGCSVPYFLSNGVCVSNCPSGAYPDTQNRVCKSCSSNCFSCLTNTFCYACNAGYDLKNGICIAATLNCPAGQFRYNGVCYRTCPQGSCSQGNFCQRTCPAGTWDYNGGCYRNCPTKLTTADACVDTCPSGTSLVNGVCQVGSQACPSGQFWDGSSSSCKACQYPCTECSLTASYCTACSAGLTLNQNLCVSTANTCGRGNFRDTSGRCQACPEKCAECISSTICSACASTYNFNGNDCVKAIGQLQQISLRIKSTSKRGNAAYLTVCPNIIPNGLSPQQQNNFFSVVPSSGDKNNVAYINQWLSLIDSGCVTVAINYNSFPAQSHVFLAVNAQLLAGSYMSIGYMADASTFVSAPINLNLPATPAEIVAPANAAATFSSSTNDMPMTMAVKFSQALGEYLA